MIGWEAESKLYPQPDILDSKDIDLSDKTYLITGANAGNESYEIHLCCNELIVVFHLLFISVTCM